LGSELLTEVEDFARFRLSQEGEYIRSQGRSNFLNYRYEHTVTVVGLARKLVEIEGADEFICIAGAWLHDLGKCYNPDLDPEENRRRREDHGYYGAEEAGKFLDNLGVETETIEEIYQGIYKHVGLTRKQKEPIKPLSAAIIWDADKLSKIGLTAWMHFIAYSFNREQDDGTYEQLWQRDNLPIMEKIRENLNLEISVDMADKRLEYYREYLKRLKAELRGKK